jgi:hypothetical protein
VARRLAVEWTRQIVGDARAGPPFLFAEVKDHPSGCGGDVEATRRIADEVQLAFPTDGFLDYAELRLLGLRAATLSGSVVVSQVPPERPLDTPPDELDLATATMVLAMSGVRALDLGSLTPLGDEGFGNTPVDCNARITPVGQRVGDSFWLLDAIDHPHLNRRAGCLLLFDRELARLREARAACASLPAGLGSLRSLRALRVQAGAARQELQHDFLFDGLFDGLRRASIPFGVADTSIPNEKLADVGVILVPSFGCMTRALVQRLFEWAADGGTLIIGPVLPERDWSGAPLSLPVRPQVKEHRKSFRLGGLLLPETDLYVAAEPVIETPDGVLAAGASLGRGRLICFGFTLPFGALQHDPETLGWILRELVGTAGLAPCYAASDPEIETELHEGPVRRFLFIANPTGKARDVTIDLGSRESLREVRGRGEYVRAGQKLIVEARAVIVREIVPI